MASEGIAYAVIDVGLTGRRADSLAQARNGRHEEADHDSDRALAPSRTRSSVDLVPRTTFEQSHASPRNWTARCRAMMMRSLERCARLAIIKLNR